jgi:hypothetical protein
MFQRILVLQEPTAFEQQPHSSDGEDERRDRGDAPGG